MRLAMELSEMRKQSDSEQSNLVVVLFDERRGACLYTFTFQPTHELVNVSTYSSRLNCRTP